MNACREAVNAALANWFNLDRSTTVEKIRRIRSVVGSKRKITGIAKDLFVLGRKLM